MSKFRDILSEEQRGEFLASRINQLAQNGYQLELDLLVVLENDDEVSAEQLKQQIKIIEDAIAIHKKELQEI